jgi:putative endonuclease
MGEDSIGYNKRQIGGHYETVAASYLRDRGMEILASNYRCRMGEIDLIGKIDKMLVFCEVKYRKNKRTGDPSEAVDARKQRKIFQVASYYMKQYHCPANTPCRFDVIAMTGEGEQLEIRWIPNAFGIF